MRKIKDFFLKNKSIVLILLAVILGAVLGLAGKSFSLDIRSFISTNIFGIFQKIYIKIIGYIAGPLIFITITTSIYKMGNFKTFFGRGRRYLLSFIAIMLITGTVVTFASLPIFNLSIDTGSSLNNSFSEITRLLGNFLPKNLWDPFLTINLIQVDVLAMVAGITLLAFGKYAEDPVKILDKISRFLITIMRFVAKFVPLYVLCAIVGIIWNNDVQSLGGIYKFLILFVVFAIGVNALMLVITSIYQKVSIKKLFLACLHPFIRAITTANSTIAMTNQYTSAKRLGISKTESSFGIPLSISFFKIASIVYLALIATYYYSLNHSSVTLVWIVLEIILTTLLTISIAPVSGGGLSNYSMLVNQLSINPIYLGLIVALDPVMDFFITGLNTFIQPLQLLNVSSKNKEVNINVLRDNRVILVCGAMDVETDWLIDQLENKSAHNFDNYKLYKGSINKQEIWVLQTGIGMENAFISTTKAIETISPTELISIGTSGGHHKDLKRGDIIVANKIINYDNNKDVALIPNKNFANPFLKMNNTKPGIVLTSDTWHKNVVEINSIHEKTGSDVEEMESYISCKAASDNSLNFVALRIVSNNATTNEEYVRETGIELQKSLYELLKKNA